jgi:cysteine desulfurase/selenocysteine lyase
MNHEQYFLEKRKDFPILNEKIRGEKLIYFDSAATSQKPKCVIHSLTNYYSTLNSNVHRGDHLLSQKSTDLYEETRESVANLLSTQSKNISFNAGATAGMNQVAYGLKHTFKAEDEIVITEMEHHSNMLIWIELAKELNLVLKVIPLDSNFGLDYKKANELINSKTKLVAFSHMSNVLGTINDVALISKLAHNVGALTLVDGCQGIVHTKVDVNNLDCDFYVFSAHKLYGPTGVGVLYGKNLNLLKPMFYGGGQIERVSLGLKQNSEPEIGTFDIKYLDAPFHLESGTPNVADIIGFKSALKYLDELELKKLHVWDLELGDYFLTKLQELGNDIVLYGKNTMVDRGNVFAFRYLDKHPTDICTFLDQFGIATRGGLHCAQPLHDKLGISGTIRVSFCFYNTKKEIDYFIESMKKIKGMF